MIDLLDGFDFGECFDGWFGVVGEVVRAGGDDIFCLGGGGAAHLNKLFRNYKP